MFYKYIFVPLTVLPHNFHPCGTSTTITAQREANASNEKIAANNLDYQREANAQAIEESNVQRNWMQQMYNQQFSDENKMFDRQIAADWEKWHAQNAYNESLAMRSPSMQRQALENAGLNPALLMSGGSMGSVASSNFGSSSGASVPSAGTPSLPNTQALHNDMHYEPIDYASVGRAISGSLNETLQNLNAIQDLDSKRIDNATRSSMNLASIDKMIADREKQLADAHTSRTTATRIQEDIARLRATFDSYVQGSGFNALNAQLLGKVYQEQAINLAAERSNLEFQQKLAEKKFNLDAQTTKAVVSEIYRRIASMDVQDELTYQQARKTAEEVVVTSLQGQGIKLDNKTKEDLSELVVTKYEQEVRNLLYQNEQMVPDVIDARTGAGMRDSRLGKAFGFGLSNARSYVPFLRK